MLDVLRITDENIDKVMEFLEQVPTISNVDEDILSNGVFILDSDKDNENLSCVSFEIYGHSGLIRYFVFKKSLPDEILEKLILELCNRAKEKGLKNLVAIAETFSLSCLFESVGFEYVDLELASAVDRELLEKASMVCPDFEIFMLNI